MVHSFINIKHCQSDADINAHPNGMNSTVVTDDQSDIVINANTIDVMSITVITPGQSDIDTNRKENLICVAIPVSLNGSVRCS